MINWATLNDNTRFIDIDLGLRRVCVILNDKTKTGAMRIRDMETKTITDYMLTLEQYERFAIHKMSYEEAEALVLERME